MEWLLGGGGLAIGAAFAILAWKLANVRADRDAAVVEAAAAERRADDIEQAARQERERREGVIRVLRLDLETARRKLADLVRGNPELAREYVRGQLRELAGPEADPGPHPEVPGPAGPAPVGGDRGRGA